jgi:hypothetical protein
MVGVSLDYACRRITMCSILYYGFSANSPLSDGEFDAMCQYVADNWSKLEPVWKWKLGSAEAIRASGFHIRCSWRDYYGTLDYDRAVNGYRGLYHHDQREMKQSKKFQLEYGSVETVRRSE